MPRLYYFDTSALQHRYIQSGKSHRVRKAISDGRNTCIISDVTIIEIASALARHCRSNSLSRIEYRRLNQEFWKDVRSGKLVIRAPTQRDYIKALHLLEHAGVQMQRRVTSFDALIAAGCQELALERCARVKFLLDDRPLYDVIHRLPAYKAVIDFRFIGRYP